MGIIEEMESEVRSYCRSFPAVFERGQGCYLYDKRGRSYLDFFSGAGALNYGHNPPRMKERLLRYIQGDGIVHSLDMATAAKEELLERLETVLFKPRGLHYKVQFPGPTGTNAVESALKLARKVTQREKVLYFTNAFHGMTLGSLAVTGNSFKRGGAGMALTHGICMPFDGYLGEEVDTIAYMERFLEDNGSGIDLPAAAIVETVQAEGGINVARFEWLQRLEKLCHKYDMLLIVDDIQVGCGRTGPFLSFEPAGIKPDIVCLSKSLSGYGLPLALTLLKPDWDRWQPGEHNGTFRGHNLAFVTASEALAYWEGGMLSHEVLRKGVKVQRFLAGIARKYPEAQAEIRGRGLIQGIACAPDGLAGRVCREAFKRGLVLETSGPDGYVVKLMPPLVIEDADLEAGLRILEEAVGAALGKNPSYAATQEMSFEA